MPAVILQTPPAWGFFSSSRSPRTSGKAVLYQVGLSRIKAPALMCSSRVTVHGTVKLVFLALFAVQTIVYFQLEDHRHLFQHDGDSDAQGEVDKGY